MDEWRRGGRGKGLRVYREGWGGGGVSQDLGLVMREALSYTVHTLSSLIRPTAVYRKQELWLPTVC